MKSTMQAAVYFRYGAPDVVKVAELPLPEPGPNEYLVRVHTATVNRTDCGFRSANYFISRFWSGLFRPRQAVLGCEFAGEIVQAGANTASFKPGDRVYGYDDAGFACHAEYRICNEQTAMAQIPDGYTWPEAAPLTEGSHYALCSLRSAGVKAGQAVLVYGATGAIGSAAVQLLHAWEVRVVAVCGSDYTETVQALGAQRVLDYTREDYTRCGEQFDMVFDAVGKSTFAQAKKVLKPGGVYVSTELGAGAQNVWLALLGKFTRGKRVLFPIPLTRKDDIEYLGKLAGEGKFRPVIDRSYPLSEIVEAYRYVETGMKVGNVVIDMNG
jgi:NADPH:quinone reductase-like Zn-dependent oxidoreductase